MIGRPHRAAIALHRLEVAVRGDREAGFDDVDAQAIELLGQAQLLGRRHAEARGLLAVAERRVEDCVRDLVAMVCNSGFQSRAADQNKSK